MSDRGILLPSTVRVVSPDVTLTRIEPIAKRLGITRVANVTGLDTVGVPVWIAIRPLAKSLSVSQGKGLTHELAKCSGIMESIELFHAENFRPTGVNMPLTAYASDADFINPARLPMHASAEIDEEKRMYWVHGVDIFSNREKLIPHDLFDLDATKPERSSRVFVSSSNGLASGNTHPEATLHGLCEAIERDQLSMWLVKDRLELETKSTRLNLDSIEDSLILELIDRCRHAKLEIFVWYATTNINIPVFVCVVADQTGSTLFHQRAAGSGCHPLKSIALCRAITEALQSRLTHICGTRDDVYWKKYREDIICSSKSATKIEEMRRMIESVNYAHISDGPGSIDIEKMLDYTKSALWRSGITEAIVVNLTQSQIGIPVVYVCVPDLEFSVLKPVYTPGRRMLEALSQWRTH